MAKSLPDPYIYTKINIYLQISRWYKWLRFKDIVQGFEKLKKMVEKNEMEQNDLED